MVSVVLHREFVKGHIAFAVPADDVAREAIKRERDLLRLCFNALFNYVKKNFRNGALYYFSAIKTSAINSAAEMIQVAAIAQKAMDSIKQGNW